MAVRMSGLYFQQTPCSCFSIFSCVFPLYGSPSAEGLLWWDAEPLMLPLQATALFLATGLWAVVCPLSQENSVQAQEPSHQ